jgi:hypothetical protein
MGLLTRVVECQLMNNSALTLQRVEQPDELLHGEYTAPPPADMSTLTSGRDASWSSETAGLMTGTEGSVTFRVLDADIIVGSFVVYWDNPFIGTNEYSQTFTPSIEDFEEKYGNYCGDYSVIPIVDDDEVKVIYSFAVVAPEATAASPGEAAAETPPDPDAAHPVTATSGQTACVSGAAPPDPPRLIVALNEVDPPDKGKDGSVDGILKTVAGRLERGLAEVWQGGECKLWDPNVWRKDDVDELWARAITEVLLGMPYVTPEVAFTANKVGLKQIYKQFNNQDDPKIGVTSECQHLVTYAMLARGYAYEEGNKGEPKGVPSSGFGCSSSESCPLFKSENHGAWYKDTALLTIEKAMALDVPLSPASVVAANPNPLKGQPEGSHTYFVLRVDTRGKRTGQLFDTGGAGRKGPVPEATQGAFGAFGLYDNGLITKLSAMKGFLGLGVPPKDESVVKKMIPLPKRVEMLRKTRRVGLARLIIAEKGVLPGVTVGPLIEGTKVPSSPGVLYVSPLLRMWGDDALQNFSYGGYLWSLRELGAEGKDVWWVFYSPRGKLVDALYEKPRSTKLADLGALYSMSNAMIVGAISSRSDGKAIFRLRAHAIAEETEMGFDGDGEVSKSKSVRCVFLTEPDPVKRKAKQTFLMLNFAALDKLLRRIPAGESWPPNHAFNEPGLFKDAPGAFSGSPPPVPSGSPSGSSSA